MHTTLGQNMESTPPPGHEIELLTCSGGHAGWIKPEHLSDVPTSVKTKDHRIKGGILPGGIGWTEDPNYILQKGDIIVRDWPSFGRPFGVGPGGGGEPGGIGLAVVVCTKAGFYFKEWNSFHACIGSVLKTSAAAKPDLSAVPAFVQRRIYTDSHGIQYELTGEYREPRTGEYFVSHSYVDLPDIHDVFGPVHENASWNTTKRAILRRVS